MKSQMHGLRHAVSDSASHSRHNLLEGIITGIPRGTQRPTVDGIITGLAAVSHPSAAVDTMTVSSSATKISQGAFGGASFPQSASRNIVTSSVDSATTKAELKKKPRARVSKKKVEEMADYGGAR